MRSVFAFAAIACLAIACSPANAAFLIEIDTDGADDGVLTFNPNFSFGGDTTTASQSAPSNAVGLSGADSIFGGDGANLPDTYVYSYTPSADADNLQLGAGTPLNDDGDYATALTAGIATTHAVYATWPFTTNVSGGDTNFTLSDSSGEVLSKTLDQNGGGEGTGHEWILLGTFELDPSESYTLTQSVTVANTFVSMRASAVMFEAIPEPSSAVLLALAGLGVVVAARRR